ncbi:hypothetical protein ONS95_012891 [Cadophora gregata]|uniref:uncharacterized protein n=1 Tax=Cadophora gregata TaxID=51156 RepID=UPI0026DC7835|nr:uncharacterized protein ONS95_012891 [Cadophora gregata]KAK0101127.1 hypothetical protein ONS96_006352 [Cadophora gregata f. sp. sojae]KAK0115841.1 hypothetical protein ONS95_012891 [Cadophora gregata]
MKSCDTEPPLGVDCHYPATTASGFSASAMISRRPSALSQVDKSEPMSASDMVNTGNINSTAMTIPTVSPHLSGIATSTNESFSFTLLKSELPDPKLELYYQWTPTTTFHLFSNLPAELRLHIWRLSQRGRKIFAWIDDDLMLQCRTAVPPVLQVNHEARTEMLKHYTAPGHIPGFPSRRPALSRFYFDPANDTVIFEEHSSPMKFQGATETGENAYVREVLDTIQSVIIGPAWWYTRWEVFDPAVAHQVPFGSRGERRLQYFKLFSSLQRLVLVGGCHGLQYDHQRILCIKSLSAMFKRFRDEGAGRGAVEITVLMKCHQEGAVECDTCWIGLNKEEVRAQNVLAKRTARN